MKIEMDKKYTRNGTPVRILCTDMAGRYPVVGIVTTVDGCERAATFTADGRYYSNKADHDYNLVEVSPYADYKIDDPVLVQFIPNGPIHRRHFAGLNSNGAPMTYPNGKTSWTRGFDHAEYVVTVNRPE